MTKNLKPNTKTIVIKCSQDEYDNALVRILNAANIDIESSTKQEWAIAYYESLNLNTSKLSKLNPMLFDQVGVLCHLKQNGILLRKTHDNYITKKYEQFRVMAEPDEQIKKEKSPKIKKENDNIDFSVISQLEQILDDIIFRKAKKIDPGKFFKDKKINKETFETLKIVFTNYKKEYDHVFDTYTTDETRESYGHILFSSLKLAIEFIESVLKECNTGVIKKIVRRQTRAKSPKSIIKKLKYLQEDKDLGLESFNPIKLIGIKELIVFNTKTRKIFVYKSADENGLGVKGSTLINFDDDSSFSKTIRKPEVFFKDFEKLGKRETTNKIKEIKSVEGKATGRINKETLLLKYY